MTEREKSNTDWMHIAGEGEVVVQAQDEIGGILQSLAEHAIPLLAEDSEKDLFLTRVQEVNVEQGFFIVARSSNNSANAAVLASDGVDFHASYGFGQLQFRAERPVEHVGVQPGIRFSYPQSLAQRQRRSSQRVKLVPAAPLYCLANSGGNAPFETSIVDIGLNGCGVIVFDPQIKLAPGTVLHRCRIVLPDGDVAYVEIEIRYTAPFALPNGIVARRAGCRFMGSTDQIDKVIKVFVLNIESGSNA